MTARRYFIRGRVQGVGYRYFVERTAGELRINGYTRNLDDGRVEVYAIGPASKLDKLRERLSIGPRFADVRGVDEQDAAVEQCGSFRIEN
jgi:acylphosphatase